MHRLRISQRSSHLKAGRFLEPPSIRILEFLHRRRCTHPRAPGSKTEGRCHSQALPCCNRRRYPHHRSLLHRTGRNPRRFRKHVSYFGTAHSRPRAHQSAVSGRGPSLQPWRRRARLPLDGLRLLLPESDADSTLPPRSSPVSMPPSTWPWEITTIPCPASPAS